MCGKNSILFLTIIVFFSHSSQNAKFKQAEIRGGLLFEKDTERPVIVNPNYIAYKRKLVLTDIFAAVDLTHQFTYEYKQFCDTVRSTLNSDLELRYNAYKYRYTSLPGRMKVFDGAKTCKEFKFKVPEVRTRQDLKDLRSYMYHNKITAVDIGYSWDAKSGRLLYDSDKSVIPHFITTALLRQKGDIIPNKMGIYDPLAIMAWGRATGNRGYLMFEKDDEPLLVPFNNVEEWDSVYAEILCDKGGKAITARSNGFLLDIAAHLCARDYENLAGSTELVSQESSLFRSIANEPVAVDVDPKVASSCPSLANFDNKRTSSLRAEIKRVGARLSKDLNLPPGVTTRFVIFRALSLISEKEFKHFLLSDVTRSYIHHNPTQVLLNALACQIDLELHFNPKEHAKFSFEKMFTYTIPDLDPIIHAVNVLTSPLSLINTRHKRSVLAEISVNMVPQAPIFNKNTFSYKIGIATVSDLERTFKYIGMNAVNLAVLSINQKEIAKAYESLKEEIQLLQNVTREADYATATIIAVLDNKSVITQLHNVIRQSLLIASTSINAAYMGKPSPYVLSEAELDNLAKEARNKNIFLTNDLEDIKTTVVKYKNEYTFLFLVPVIDNKYLFRLFNVRNFPIFAPDNSTQEASIDAQHIGISIDLTNYIELTETEYTECLKSTFCGVTTVGGKITEKSRCVARTYKHKEQHCELSFSNDTIPFFATYGNQTVYSTPIDYTGSLLCPTVEARTEEEPITGYLNFSGVGTVHIKPGCTVELPDGRIISPHYHTNLAFDLGPSTMSQAFQFLPSLTEYKFKPNVSHQQQYNELNPIELEEMNYNDLGVIFTQSITMGEMVPHIVRALIIIGAIILSLLLLYCLVPKFREWVKACCFCNNPKKFWDKKGYDVPGFERIKVRGKSFQFRHHFNKLKRNHQGKIIEPIILPQEAEMQNMIYQKRAECEATFRQPLKVPKQLKDLDEPEFMPEMKPCERPPVATHVTGPIATRLTHKLNNTMFP